MPKHLNSVNLWLLCPVEVVKYKPSSAIFLALEKIMELMTDTIIFHWFKGLEILISVIYDSLVDESTQAVQCGETTRSHSTLLMARRGLVLRGVHQEVKPVRKLLHPAPATPNPAGFS